jgi:hypothetical protein
MTGGIVVRFAVFVTAYSRGSLHAGCLRNIVHCWAPSHDVAFPVCLSLQSLTDPTRRSYTADVTDIGKHVGYLHPDPARQGTCTHRM